MKRKRYRPKYDEWRMTVLKRDNYCCQHCGKKNKRNIAHHIIEWDKDILLRYEENNGLTLCNKCHTKHHSIGREAWNKGKIGIYTKQTKLKMRLAKLGNKANKKTRIKMSEAQKKVIHTEERNRKISEAKKGIKFTLEHRQKLSKAFKGKKAWNKGIPMRESSKVKQRKRYENKTWIIDPATNKRKWIEK